MRRQDNPCLLWLHAEARCNRMTDDDGFDWWSGYCGALTELLDVCRWLDAEDEWVESLHYRGIPGSDAYRNWHRWRDARMAEAGVL